MNFSNFKDEKRNSCIVQRRKQQFNLKIIIKFVVFVTLILEYPFRLARVFSFHYGFYCPCQSGYVHDIQVMWVDTCRSVGHESCETQAVKARSISAEICELTITAMYNKWSNKIRHCRLKMPNRLFKANSTITTPTNPNTSVILSI